MLKLTAFLIVLLAATPYREYRREEMVSEGEASGTAIVGPGATTPGAAVFGKCTNWVGVYGESEKHNGVHGESKSQSGNGVTGFNTSSNGGIGVFGYALHRVLGVILKERLEFLQGGQLHFEGDVEVTGEIRLLNADCAEDFDIFS